MPGLDIPVPFLSDCSEITLDSFSLNCLNQIANLKKERQEVEEETIEWSVRMEVAQWFATHKDEIIEALRAQMIKDSPSIGPQRAERVERKTEAA